MLNTAKGLEPAPFPERLSELVARSEKSAAAIAGELGVSRQTMSAWMSGRRVPRRPMAEALAKYFGVTVAWLTERDAQKSDPACLGAIPLTNMHAIPIIGTVRAGAGGLAYEEPDGVEYADVRHPERYFYLRVEGDSMAPQIMEGDLALVRKQEDVESGDLAVVVINGDEGVIKKVLKSASAIVLQSFNPAYLPRIFSRGEMNELRIAGKVERTVRVWH